MISDHFCPQDSQKSYASCFFQQNTNPKTIFKIFFQLILLMKVPKKQRFLSIFWKKIVKNQVIMSNSSSGHVKITVHSSKHPIFDKIVVFRNTFSTDISPKMTKKCHFLLFLWPKKSRNHPLIVNLSLGSPPEFFLLPNTSQNIQFLLENADFKNYCFN